MIFYDWCDLFNRLAGQTAKPGHHYAETDNREFMFNAAREGMISIMDVRDAVQKRCPKCRGLGKIDVAFECQMVKESCPVCAPFLAAIDEPDFHQQIRDGYIAEGSIIPQTPREVAIAEKALCKTCGDNKWVWGPLRPAVVEGGVETRHKIDCPTCKAGKGRDDSGIKDQG